MCTVVNNISLGNISWPGPPGPQLYVSSWDVRGFTLEPSMERLELPPEGQEDTEGCTGDQLTDTEKATILPTTSHQVCGWLARAYGLKDAAYYEAYNNELHRQALLLA